MNNLPKVDLNYHELTLLDPDGVNKLLYNIIVLLYIETKHLSDNIYKHRASGIYTDTSNLDQELYNIKTIINDLKGILNGVANDLYKSKLKILDTLDILAEKTYITINNNSGKIKIMAEEQGDMVVGTAIPSSKITIINNQNT